MTINSRIRLGLFILFWLIASMTFAQQPKITNSFADTEIRQALADVSAAAKVTIVPDETVQGSVSAELKDVPLDEALTILLSPGGYSWKRIDNYYLVGKADPTSPNFLRFAVSKEYRPNFTTAEKLVLLLPDAMKGYVKSAPGERGLVITAAPAMMDRIMQDVKMLDTPAPKVILEALVTEVNSETLNQYDFSFIWKTFGFSSDTQGQDMSFKYTKATQADVANMKLLISKGLADIKANPRIMTLEGREANIEVGQESYFQVLSGPVGYAYSTIQQIKTGISLKMTPYLSDDGQITVQLNPEVSDVTGAGPGGLPINTVRRANTTVRVKDGETIIIGGMTFESKRRRDSKVPLLGDLPIFGGLFRFYHNETKKTEVVIMVTPKVIKDGDSLDDEALAHGISNPPGNDKIETKREDKAKPEPKDGSPLDAPLISINDATADQLQELPGIGKVLSQRIVDYRQANGPFKTIDGLLRVNGIGPKTLDKIRGRLRL